MAVMGGIYAVRCLDSGRGYFGSTTNLSARFSQHRRLLAGCKHHCAQLQADWNLYGPDGFEFKTLAVLEKSELSATEQRVLDAKFKSDTKPYNTALDATAPMKGRKHSEKTLETLSAINTGEQNGFFGRSHSDATKLQISKAKIGTPAPNKGVPMSEEAKAKVSLAKTGVPSKKIGTHSDVCKQGHEKTEQTAYIRNGHWHCRVCRSLASQRYQSKLKGA